MVTGRQSGKGKEGEEEWGVTHFMLQHLQVVRLIFKAVVATGGSGAQEGCGPGHVSSGSLEHTEKRKRGLGAREPLEARGLMGDSLRAAPVSAEVGWGRGESELSMARGFDCCP